MNDTSTTEGDIPFDEDLLEDESLWNLRRWHVILIFLSGFFAIVIGICCCFRFRIPRTKQEIEADYIRKKITMKFKKQLKLIQNSEMDEMDLKKALDRVRAEFKSDTESIAQSEVFSIVSTPRSLADSPPYCQSFRKTSEIGINIDDLIEQQKEKKERAGRSRFTKFVDSIKIVNRPKPPLDSSIPLTEQENP
ncbi:uncharacterized protein [Halyomorpha halys]|uniref:uncharacterized protein n=1 Tax=Halyomorpha halys TaxID=286706 RepID=UPI0006D52273|nr:uncharacterized protein LOC106680194 [Halyomorpha halys]